MRAGIDPGGAGGTVTNDPCISGQSGTKSCRVIYFGTTGWFKLNSIDFLSVGHLHFRSTGSLIIRFFFRVQYPGVTKLFFPFLSWRAVSMSGVRGLSKNHGHYFSIVPHPDVPSG